MTGPGWVVVTSVAPPTPGVRAFAAMRDWQVVVVGDRKSPAGWSAPPATFVPLDVQHDLGLRLATALPVDHYSRKNVGYLLAMRAGAPRIFDTDDDNVPLPGLPDLLAAAVAPSVAAPAWSSADGWLNPYPWFTGDRVWPRGFPLELVLSRTAPVAGDAAAYECPVRQYLADGDPDVDAVYRLTVGKADHEFAAGTVVVDTGTYVPFNSQCTLWFTAAYPLLYLPSLVTFRMTDIWRSFVAQACLHAMGARVAYHGPAVRQERNPHDLRRDLVDELPGYAHNARLVGVLREVPLAPEPEAAGANLRACYAALVGAGLVAAGELDLVDAWLLDVAGTAG